MKNQYKISSFSTILIFIVLSICGLAILPLVNVQLNPSRTNQEISVRWNWQNANPYAMEKEVTSKLEGTINLISGIKEITSSSRNGTGVININFKRGVDVEAAQFEIQNAIRRVYPKLPKGVSFPTCSKGGSMGDENPLIVAYTLVGNRGVSQIKRYAQEVVEPQLALVKNIHKIEIGGSTPMLWSVVLNSSLCKEIGVSVDDVFSSINNYLSTDDMGMCNLSHSPNLYSLQIESTKEDSIDWNRIPIKKYKGRLLHLSDLASIRYIQDEADSYKRVNGINSVSMMVYAEAGVNTIKLTDEVKRKVEEIESRLPKGWSINKVTDDSIKLKKELRITFLRTLFSLLILLVFVFIISRSFKYLFYVFSALFVNLAVAFIFYYLFSIEIQLYSLAGITISLGIIIDNSIVMIDHVRYKGRNSVFLAILAATLTTVGALVVVFLLDERTRLNLIDFAAVIMVNLSVSLLVAFFFIPSVMERFPIAESLLSKRIKDKRRFIKFSGIYEKWILFSLRRRGCIVLILILTFGIPIFLLPKKITNLKDDGGVKIDSKWIDYYNKTIGDETFSYYVRPKLDKWLGGTFYLFNKNTYTSYQFGNTDDQKEHKISVFASMKEGSTIEDLNSMMKNLEGFLAKFDQIEQFVTTINSKSHGSIEITFTEEGNKSFFPLTLYEALVEKVVNLDGMDWYFNLKGSAFEMTNTRPFSNATGGGGSRNCRFELSGYNLDQLYSYASAMVDTLKKLPRMSDFFISGDPWSFDLSRDFYLTLDKKKSSLYDWSPTEFNTALTFDTQKKESATLYHNREYEKVAIVSDRFDKLDVWSLQKELVKYQEKCTRLGYFADIKKRESTFNIAKKNQEYILYVQANFTGPRRLIKEIQEEGVDRFSTVLPIGYSVKTPEGWSNLYGSSSNNSLLFLVIAIIFLICSVLLESLKQPLAIVAMIPSSFIGVFLIFYFLGSSFDEGGYASFILLCGLVVNAALYIVNDFNQYNRSRNHKNQIRNYIKAYHHKIIPIILTILSTILGLIPFLIGGESQRFWYSFAVGSIGGLVMSLAVLILILPCFVIQKEKRSYVKKKKNRLILKKMIRKNHKKD